MVNTINRAELTGIAATSVHRLLQTAHALQFKSENSYFPP